MKALLTLVRFVLDREIVVLGVFALVVSGLGAFVLIAENVTDRDTQEFDDWALRGLRSKQDPAVPVGPAWVGKATRDISALGSMSVLLLLTASAAGYLWLSGRRPAMWLLLVSTFGGGMLSMALKAAFGRSRPDAVPHLEAVTSASFPSGHSMLAAIVYLTLGAMLARVLSPMRLRIYVLAVAVGLTVLVGASRALLGVHYPTDILAGWTAGTVWSLLCWSAAWALEDR